MNISVLVPWRGGSPWRERAWSWARERYPADWQIVTGTCPDGPFSRSQAIIDAACRSDGDVLVVADADIWCDPIPAVEAVDEHGWAVPHSLIHRLAPDSTLKVLAGVDWHGLPLSTDNPQDSRPYRGHETGTLLAIRRDVLLDVPPDPRFVGWGQEDDAWSAALRCLVGAPWRGNDDLVHLWHPPQPRQSRVTGSPEGRTLCDRYRAASHSPDRMRALIAEARVDA